MSEPRTYSGSLFTPATATRKERRAADHAARGVITAARKSTAALAKLEREALTAEAKAAQYLPAKGERGPATLRARRRFKVPTKHSATTNVLAGANLFLAERGLGDHGIYVGQDAWAAGPFCFDPWLFYRLGILTNPNLILAGDFGVGKSVLAKSLTCRGMVYGHKVYVPCDVKGEWVVVAEAVDGQSIQLGGGSTNRLNPLDAGPRPKSMGEGEWLSTVASRRRALLGSLNESALGRDMTSVEHTALGQALKTVVAAEDEPTLPMVVDAMFHPTLQCDGATLDQLRDDGRLAAHALRRLVDGDLAGLFDGPSTVKFDPDLPMVVIDLSKISGNDQMIRLVMTCASAWMEAALADPAGGTRWMVYDEAWRFMTDPALLTRLQSQVKLCRHLGISNLFIVHRLSDFLAGEAGSQVRALAEGLVAGCQTRIVMQQDQVEAALAAKTFGLTTTVQDMLPTLPRGRGVWTVNQRTFIVDHLPSADELVVFNTDDRMS